MIVRCYTLGSIGFALLLAFVVWADKPGTTYYLDSTTGDDRHDGTSPERAWKSLDRANTTTFAPGDRLLLRAGRSWDGMLHPRGSGADGQSIIVDRYGKGPKPALHGRGRVPCVLRLENQQWWEIHNLEVTNRSADGPRDLRGVEVRGRDMGIVRHVHLKHLDIHDVTGVSDYRNDGDTVAKSFGGIATILEGALTPTAWDGLLIENCHIKDVGPIGLVMLSTWMRGHRDNDPKTWFPSKNVIIRGNTIERTARNGLIVRGCAGPLIERNLFSECGLTGSGNACFAFHCDDAVFQYNESCLTKYNAGDTDASGFDSDYNCRRSVFQFNYSHDNDYGFMLICNRPPGGFNDGTIVRYNVSQNDGGNVIRVSGAVTNARVYNNTVFVGEKSTNPKAVDPPRVVYFKAWNKGWANDVTFFNNVIVNESPRAVYEFGESTGTLFRRNLFFGRHPTSEPADAEKMTRDPLFGAPGGAGRGLRSAIAAYSLRAGSPAIGAGVAQAGHSPVDGAGRATRSTSGRVDLGAVSAEPGP